MMTLKHAFNAKDMNSLVYKILKGKVSQKKIIFDPQFNSLSSSGFQRKCQGIVILMASVLSVAATACKKLYAFKY